MQSLNILDKYLEFFFKMFKKEKEDITDFTSEFKNFKKYLF